LQHVRSAADEDLILDAASKRLNLDRQTLILVADQEGYLVKNTATQECWKIEQLNDLPEIEPAN
jgi:hypothetical protein